MNVFPPVHIVLAKQSQLTDYPNDAYVALKKRWFWVNGGQKNLPFFY
jgi:hypothetical protein